MYKLINLETKDFLLCDKVTIDGFDYYVSDKTIKKEDGWCWDSRYKKLVTPEQNFKTSTHNADFYWKIIATNNPNIDLPRVVDEVENLAIMASNKIITDRNGNPDKTLVSHYKEGYNKSQETHPNSDEDMIEFAEWIDNNSYFQSTGKWFFNDFEDMNKDATLIASNTKELIKLWKKQKPKIVYYINKSF